MKINSFKKLGNRIKKEYKKLDKLTEALCSAEEKFSKQSEKVYILEQEMDYWKEVTK